MTLTRIATLPVKRPSAALLYVQLLSILLYPLMQDTALQRAAFRVIGLLVLGAALYVVKRGPWLTGVAAVLALPVVVLSIWLAIDCAASADGTGTRHGRGVLGGDVPRARRVTVDRVVSDDAKAAVNTPLAVVIALRLVRAPFSAQLTTRQC